MMRRTICNRRVRERYRHMLGSVEAGGQRGSWTIQRIAVAAKAKLTCWRHRASFVPSLPSFLYAEVLVLFFISSLQAKLILCTMPSLLLRLCGSRSWTVLTCGNNYSDVRRWPLLLHHRPQHTMWRGRNRYMDMEICLPSTLMIHQAASSTI